MKIVKGKLKEITRDEYEDIKAIIRMMRCFKDGEDMCKQYLGLKDSYESRIIASNVLSAVYYDYKYFKIIG